LIGLVLAYNFIRLGLLLNDGNIYTKLLLNDNFFNNFIYYIICIGIYIIKLLSTISYRIFDK